MCTAVTADSRISPEDVFCPYCGAPNQSAGDQGNDETVLFHPRQESDENITIPTVDYDAPVIDDISEKPKKNILVPIIVAVSMMAALAIGIFVIAPIIQDASAGNANGKKDVASVSVSDSAQTESQAVNSISGKTVDSGQDLSGSSSAGTQAPVTPEPVYAVTPTAGAATKDASAAAVTPVTVSPTATAVPTAAPTPNTVSAAAVTEAPAASTGTSFDADTSTSYFWPDADTRYYSESDLQGLTPLQIRYITNEIFAREGYIFKKEEWYNYFIQKEWYHPTVPADQFTDSMLNAYEKGNVDMISAYEKAHNINQDI